MPRSVLQLDSRDNVLIALTDLKAGEQIEFGGQVYVLPKTVPAKHKLAMRSLNVGDNVIMYGVLVGRAVKPIAPGELLTTSNIQHQAAPFHEQSNEFHWTPPEVSRWQHKTFLGYQRSDGQVGTRNYWLVVPLVFCENKNIQVLKQALEEELGFAAPQLYRRQVADLAKLYQQRWEIETNLRHLKQTLHMDVLRTKTVNGIHKELAMFAIVYNLVRLVMLSSAKRRALPVTRISFIDAQRWLSHAPLSAPPRKLIVLPVRPDRFEPRVRKRRPKEYDLMNKPRRQLKQALIRKQVTS